MSTTLLFPTLTVFTLSLLLTAAGAMKLIAVATDPYFDLSIPFPSVAIVPFAVTEILIGGTCAINWARAVLDENWNWNWPRDHLPKLHLKNSWTILAITFTVLLSAALYTMASGGPNCGCFGSFAISKLLALTIDLIAIVSLVMACRLAPIFDSYSDWWFSSVSVLKKYCPTLVTVLLSLVLLSCVEKSRAIERINCALGRIQVITRMIAPPKFLESGIGTCSICLTNKSGESVRILGGGKSCTCVAPKIPADIPPYGSVVIPIELSPKAKGTHQRILLYVDAAQSQVSIDIDATG
jgi:hypothetical protein